MSTLDKFIARDMQNAFSKPPIKSYIGSASKKIWHEIMRGLREPRAGTSMSWAIIFKCARELGEKFDKKGIDKEEFVLQYIMPALYESISLRKDKLEKDPSWQAVLLAETDDERIDAIDDFISLCVLNFKNECIEVWRNREGTYANVYRKTQRALREHFKNVSWSLYEPKSRFFGPGGMESPLQIDELHGDKLKEIPLPNKAPVAKRIFFKDSILPLSAWFYTELNTRTPQENNVFSMRTCIAIRNMARWLCFSYPLLMNEDVVAEETMRNMVKTSCDEFTLNSDIDALARKTAFSLTPQQRIIISLKMERWSNEEIASHVGLYDPDDVMEQMDIIRRVIRNASLELPEMCLAVDMDSTFDVQDSGFLERFFSDCFMKYCLKGLDND